MIINIYSTSTYWKKDSYVYIMQKILLIMTNSFVDVVTPASRILATLQATAL